MGTEHLGSPSVINNNRETKPAASFGSAGHAHKAETQGESSELGGKTQAAALAGAGGAQAQLGQVPAPLGTGTSRPQPDPAVRLTFLLGGDGDHLKLGEGREDASWGRSPAPPAPHASVGLSSGSSPTRIIRFLPPPPPPLPCSAESVPLFKRIYPDPFKHGGDLPRPPSPTPNGRTRCNTRQNPLLSRWGKCPKAVSWLAGGGDHVLGCRGLGTSPPCLSRRQPGARASPRLALPSASQEHKKPRAMATTQGSPGKELQGGATQDGAPGALLLPAKHPPPKPLLVKVRTAPAQGPGVRRCCTSRDTEQKAPNATLS